MTKNRTPTPVYLDPGMHSGLEVKGLSIGDDPDYDPDSAVAVCSVWMAVLFILTTGQPKKRGLNT